MNCEGELLAESAEELYESAPVGYVSSLVDGRIVRVNETLLAWTGHARDDLVDGKRLHDLLAPGARIYYETHYAPLLQLQGSVGAIAVEIVRADGSRLPVLMTSTLVRDESGAPRMVRTTLVDASERRRYERELLRARADAESRARAVVALEHVAEGVVLVGDDGRLEVVNPAAESIFGVSAAAVVGRAASDALPGFAHIAESCTRSGVGESAAPVVVPVQRPDDERWVAVAAVDASEATVFTVRDVTDERRLDELRADMVAIVSHELRTPLTGALGAAQTLDTRYDALDDELRRQLVGMIVEQAQRLAKILDQILVTSQLDSQNLRTGSETFDVTEVVDGVVRGVDEGARSRIVVSADEGITARADLDRLRQVVGNLVDNALKYSGGPVRLAVEHREISVRITVSDDGPGIPAADRERVFEKFFRLDPSQRTGVGGTGLGLYIARELVQRMGGRMGMLARERGATFFVDVPLADAG
ncbi:MAG TPA: ATP-binding protein [Gaiellaceae bacterium]